MSSSPNSITSHQSFVETNYLPRHSPGPESRRMNPSESPSLIQSRIHPATQELSPFVRHRLPSPISPLRLDRSPVKLPSIHEWLQEDRNPPPVGLSTTTAGLNLSRHRSTPFAIPKPRSYVGPRTARHMPSASVSGEPHFINIHTIENDLSIQDLINLAIKRNIPIRSMIVSRLHHLFGNEVPVFPAEVHDFEWNFEASPFPGSLHVPTPEVSVATHPIPAGREGYELSGSPSTRREARPSKRRAGEHGLSGSLSTRPDLHVYPKEVHDFEKSPEGSPFPSYLRVTTEVSLARYPIPAQCEEHELSGSPSTRREARASRRRAGRMSLDFISNKRTKGLHYQRNIGYPESTGNAQVFDINYSGSNERGQKRSRDCIRRFKDMLNPSSSRFTAQRSRGGDDTFDRMEGSSRDQLPSTSTWIDVGDRESISPSGRDPDYAVDRLEDS